MPWIKIAEERPGLHYSRGGIRALLFAVAIICPHNYDIGSFTEGRGFTKFAVESLLLTD